MKLVAPLLLRLLHCILAVFICTSPSLHADSPPVHGWNPYHAANPPYGLVDLDQFSLGDYGYCRWGVLQDTNTVGALGTTASLRFTPLTLGPYTFSGNQDLFLSTSLSSLTNWNLLQASEGTWTPPSGTSNGSVSFSALPGTYHLFRKLHFRNHLEAKFLSDPLPSDARKVIVLIHGWNPTGETYHYHDEFEELHQQLKSELAGTEWHLVLYHWEEDADTGNDAVNLTASFPFIVPKPKDSSEAAMIAHHHGQHLGELLASFSALEKVQFVAHSAGSWTARAATRHLLDRTSVKCQITLLDPFIPGEIPGHVTPLLRDRMSSFPGIQSERLVYLENAYAIDLDGKPYELLWWEIRLPAWTDNVYRATSGSFNWPTAKSWHQRVDWSPGGTPDYAQASFYDSHSGPIRFYADTVKKFGARKGLAAGLDGPDMDLDRIGWKKSLFYNEPVVNPFLPTDVTTLANGGKTLSGGAHLRGDTAATAGITYRWETSPTGAEGTWLPFNNMAFSSSATLNLSSAQVSTYAGLFRLAAQTTAGYDTGDPTPVSPTVTPGGTAPSAPTNLVATAASSSLINLNWHDASTNENGFNLQRRPTSGATWTDLPNASANSQASSNITGLSAGTAYSYRVRSYNSAGASAWSSEASATTLAAAGSVFALQINATDGVQPVISNASSWTGPNTGYLFQSLPASRSFAFGTTVTVNLPLTNIGGKVFQYWLLDSTTRFYSTMACVTMNAAHTFTAVFGSTAPPVRALASLDIEGPSSVDEEDSATYKARATLTDGSSAYITPDYWHDDSSYAGISGSGVLDTEAVTSNRTVIIETRWSSGGVTKTVTKNVTIRNTAVTQTYTLTRNVIGNGSIGYSPQANSYAAGTVVSLHGNQSGGYVFSHWSGDASGTEDDITIRMDGNRAVTAHFVVDPNEGNLRVDISPPQAVAEGAAWQFQNNSVWRSSGDTANGLTPYTGKYVYFKDIPGWASPENIKVDIIGGQTTVVSDASTTYREILGAVQVTINPPQVSQAGARWRLNNGPWLESGTIFSDAPTGINTLEFLPVGGWTAPGSQSITVARGVTIVRTGNYGPPAGLPIINSVSPRTGPLSGGTVITIEGANFLPGAAVTFGGISAASVEVVSSTRITAVSPPRASYGTVALELNSGGQVVTQANGYSYLIPMGENLELVGQIGGRVDAVAVTGGYAYIGEGAGFVVIDVSNASAPVERGRIALPYKIRDIVISGNRAYAACSTRGLYVLDITTPAIPGVLGFYDTPGEAFAVVVDGGSAYVADAASGLQILDISNPSSITLTASLDTPGTATRIAVGSIGAEKFAAVADRTGGIRIVNVTNPQSPVEVSSIPPINWFGDLRLAGTILYTAVEGQEGIQIFNLSNPATPQLTGSYIYAPGAVLDLVDNELYAATSVMRVLDVSNPGSPQQIGSNFSFSSDAERMVVRGGIAYLACGTTGLRLVSVANPAAMSLRSTYSGVGDVAAVTVAGETAYLGAQNGLHIIDIRNPASPVRTGYLPGSRVTDIAITEGKALLIDYGVPGIRIVNVAQPGAPVLLSSYTAIDGWAIALTGAVPVIAGGTTASTPLPRLELLNISNPSSPQSVGSLTLDSAAGNAQSLATAGQWAFVGRNSKAIDIINLIDPSVLQRVGQFSVGGFIDDIAAAPDGNTIYFADGEGLHIVDTRDKSHPVAVSTIDPTESPSTDVDEIALSGDLLFVTDILNTYVYDITNPLLPRRVGIYDTYSSQTDVKVSGNLVFVTNHDTGLTILRLLDVDKPTVTITSPTIDGIFQTTMSLMSIGGTASDAQGVVRVTWQNDRGGGGVAQGTNTWNIPEVRLAVGVNGISVTAEDVQGNLAHDTIAITATLPDTEGPAILVTSPRAEPVFTVTGEALQLTGTAADVTGVASVTWTNDRGGSGTATGTTIWNASIPLFAGPNGITMTARDTPGNTSQKTLVVTYLPPETVPPTVQVMFPTVAQTYDTSEEVIFLSGSAADDTGVARVHWANHRGGQGDAVGTVDWNIYGLLLQPGMNVLTITAEDFAGNTAIDTLAVTFTPGDSDQDGLQDAWEILYFGTLTFSGSDDPDGDGQSNASELATGCNPANEASSFVATASREPTTGKLILTWPSLPDRTYKIETATELAGPWTTAALVTGAAGPAVATSYSEPVVPAFDGRKFYRVKLE